LIAELGKTPLQFEPGSGGHYSTQGYLMFAHVVEQVPNSLINFTRLLRGPRGLG
jgi:hypothetical protein